MDKEIKRLQELAGIISKNVSEDNEFRRKKPDVGLSSKKDDIESDDSFDSDSFGSDAERIIDVGDEEDYSYSDDLSDLPSFGRDMYDSIDPNMSSPEDEFDFSVDDSERIIDVGDEEDYEYNNDMDDIQHLFNGKKSKFATVDHLHSMRERPAADRDFDDEDMDSFDRDSMRIVDVGDEEDYMYNDDTSDIESLLNSAVSENELDEVLSCDEPASEWISDFQKSDDKKFQGDSDEKRKNRALGAYYSKCEDKNSMEEGGRFLNPEQAKEYEPDDDFESDSNRIIDVGDEEDYMYNDDNSDIQSLFNDSSVKEEGLSDIDITPFVNKIMYNIDDISFQGNNELQNKVEKFLASSGCDVSSYDNLKNCLNTMGADELEIISDKISSREFDEDIQNGYNNVKKYDAETHFPDGALGAATQKAGPTSAKHGDNALAVGMKESIKQELSESFKKYKK